MKSSWGKRNKLKSWLLCCFQLINKVNWQIVHSNKMSSVLLSIKSKNFIVAMIMTNESQIPVHYQWNQILFKHIQCKLVSVCHDQHSRAHIICIISQCRPCELLKKTPRRFHSICSPHCALSSTSLLPYATRFTTCCVRCTSKCSAAT